LEKQKNSDRANGKFLSKKLGFACPPGNRAADLLTQTAGLFVYFSNSKP